MGNNLASNLRYYRDRAGLSQRELAARAGISKRSLAGYERSEASPSIATVIAISRILECSLDDLAGEGEAVVA